MEAQLFGLSVNEFRGLAFQLAERVVLTYVPQQWLQPSMIFEKTGIWPVNVNVFDDADFLPSSTTDIQIASDNNSKATLPNLRNI